MNSIQSQWGMFEKAVMPKDAHPIQRQEMKRSFYAGAEAILRIQHAISDGSLSDDAAVGVIEGLHQEMIIFSGEIASGKA